MTGATGPPVRRLLSGTVRWHTTTPRRAGYQRHHIVPVALYGQPGFEGLFGRMARAGFSFNRFASNGILLPARSGEARRTGMALHRGPHPGYNAVVEARIEAIRRHAACDRRWRPEGAIIEAIWRMSLLQRALRQTLDGTAPRWIWLNRRDPMRLFADAHALDRQIFNLFAE